MENQDFILCECELEPLENFVASLEEKFEVKIAKIPSVCMTMIQAEDSVEFQEFYLGEALTTECEVMVHGQRGYGICLGDEPVRSYCIAFIAIFFDFIVKIVLRKFELVSFLVVLIIPSGEGGLLVEL